MAHQVEGHHPMQGHHFDSMDQQNESAKLGMWLFLATEVLLFSGLFCAYSIYRAMHPEIFAFGHTFLDPLWGGINTVVLILSSLTMAWGVRCAQLGQRKGLIICLSLTLLGGFMFMGIKAVEYNAKIEKGVLWAAKYHWDDKEQKGAEGEQHSEASQEQASDFMLVANGDAEAAANENPDESLVETAPEGPQGLAPEPTEEAHGEHGHGEEPYLAWVFFSIYFCMTGLHGLHVLAGMGAITWILVRAIKGEFSKQYWVPVDVVGLYWHIVDLIWIFLFPLLYLIH